MIAIVDYDAGNIKSVKNALDRMGVAYELTDDPQKIIAADKVIMPGVGNAAAAIAALRAKGLDTIIRGLRKPVLGICVGMQIMCRRSEEGDARCLDIFDCDVTKFEAEPDAKVPHMGWNALSFKNGRSPLFKYINEGDCVYFVHSFYGVNCEKSTIATAEYGTEITAAVADKNIFGCQFHPEKSGEVGLNILRAFCEMKEGAVC